MVYIKVVISVKVVKMTQKMVKTRELGEPLTFFLGFFGVFSVFSVNVVRLVFPVCAIERKKW